MLIGLTGRAGAGKDTVFKNLRDIPGAKYAGMSFAGTLKQMISTMLGTDYELWEDREWKETVLENIGYSPRQLAQTLGTEWGRNALDEDFWVRIAMKKAVEAKNALGDGWHVVFTDCRFENEADFIRAAGGVIVHVERPGREDGTASAHVSENGIQMKMRDYRITATNLDELLFECDRFHVLLEGIVDARKVI